MKMKLKMFMAMSIMAFMLTLCMVSCDRHKKANVAITTEIAKAPTLDVESTISMDRQDMFMNYHNDYRWYETSIVLNDYIDSENSDGSVFSVTNVFQYLTNVTDHSADTEVVMFTHSLDGNVVETVHSFWVGDYVLNNEKIVLTFDQAYEKMMEANIPKPHSKKAVLRKAIGPNDANPQYIFGNSELYIFVDATTGDVRNYDPAFEGFENVAAPLGEWP